MFVAAYDDRLVLPDYVRPFLDHTSRFCDVNLITPAKTSYASDKQRNDGKGFCVKTIKPSLLPEFSHVSELFDRIFVNYSTNSHRFERACFLRWFALNSATASLNEGDYICLLDTDFLIGMHPSEVLGVCRTQAEGRQIDFIAEWEGEEPTGIGPEVTILTKSFLFDFCEFLLTTYYAEKNRHQLVMEYFHRVGNGLPGGICDMRALAAFCRKRQGNVFNLRNLRGVGLVNNLASLMDSEIVRTGQWIIEFERGAVSLRTAGKIQKLIGVHFQGNAAKALMHHAGVGSGPAKLTMSICDQIWVKEQTFGRKIWKRLKRNTRRVLSRIPF